MSDHPTTLHATISDLLEHSPHRAPNQKAYKVSCHQDGKPRVVYALAVSNQAAVVAVAKKLIRTECKPVPAEDLLQAMCDQHNQPLFEQPAPEPPKEQEAVERPPARAPGGATRAKK